MELLINSINKTNLSRLRMRSSTKIRILWGQIQIIFREKRLALMKAISRLESIYCPHCDSVERRSLFRAEKGWACFRMRSVNLSILWKFIWKQSSNITEYTTVRIPESIRLLKTCFHTRIFRISWSRNFLKVADFRRCSLKFWSLLHPTILNLFSLLM